MNEVRIRISVPLHKAISTAAAKRGMAASALVSLAVYEYLRERGELASNEVSPAKPDPDAMRVWLDDDD